MRRSAPLPVSNSTDDALAEVVKEVVIRCQLAHVPVSSVLAAFVVRTVSM